MTHLLVAEDNRVNLRMLTFTLQREGYEVSAAAHGLEALAYLRNHAIDLIIADIDMPEMDGLALLRTIREEPSYGTLPFIVLTASVEQQDYEAVLSLGADAVLTKPISSRKLVEAVVALLPAADSISTANLDRP